MCVVNCSAARCWWTLKYFGHENVHVMNGMLLPFTES